MQLKQNLSCSPGWSPTSSAERSTKQRGKAEQGIVWNWDAGFGWCCMTSWLSTCLALSEGKSFPCEPGSWGEFLKPIKYSCINCDRKIRVVWVRCCILLENTFTKVESLSSNLSGMLAIFKINSVGQRVIGACCGDILRSQSKNLGVGRVWRS